MRKIPHKKIHVQSGYDENGKNWNSEISHTGIEIIVFVI